MFNAMTRSLSILSSNHSLGTPSSCLSSAFPSRQEVSKLSGREWWQVAIAKALNHENGIRKGNKGASINGKGSSIDSRIIEYRKYFEQLAKLKKVLDLVKGEYEDSKNYEIIRRYTRLKGMIKRTVMYARLEVLPEVSHAIGVNSLVLMMTPGVRKPLISIPECPKSELSNRIHLLQKRISFIRAQIDQLEESYQSSKQYIFFQRYRLMKAMIKLLLTNCIDLQNNN